MQKEMKRTEEGHVEEEDARGEAEELAQAEDREKGGAVAFNCDEADKGRADAAGTGEEDAAEIKGEDEEDEAKGGRGSLDEEAGRGAGTGGQRGWTAAAARAVRGACVGKGRPQTNMEEIGHRTTLQQDKTASTRVAKVAQESK